MSKSAMVCLKTSVAEDLGSQCSIVLHNVFDPPLEILEDVMTFTYYKEALGPGILILMSGSNNGHRCADTLNITTNDFLVICMQQFLKI